MLSILHTSDIYCFDHIFHKLFHWACLLNDYTTSHKSLFVNFVMSLVYFPWNILQRQKHSRKHCWKLKTCFESPFKRATSFVRSDQRMKTSGHIFFVPPTKSKPPIWLSSTVRVYHRNFHCQCLIVLIIIITIIIIIVIMKSKRKLQFCSQVQRLPLAVDSEKQKENTFTNIHRSS